MKQNHALSYRFNHVAVIWLLLAVILVSIFAAGCSQPKPGETPGSSLPMAVHANQSPQIEVAFFHPVPGCDSCDEMGILTNETLQAYYSPELSNGTIVYRDVNLNLASNHDIVVKYDTYVDALMIGEYNTSGFHKTEIVDIWYYVYDREAFMKYLKGVIDRKLAEITLTS